MILEETGELVVVRCWCGIQHAVPESLRKEQLRMFNDGGKPVAIYCPLGHTFVPAGGTKSEKIEKELARERQQHDQTKAELRETENRRRAEKAAKARIKKRVGNGVCIHCNRSFDDLRKHMLSKHSGEMECE